MRLVRQLGTIGLAIWLALAACGGGGDGDPVSAYPRSRFHHDNQNTCLSPVDTSSNTGLLLWTFPRSGEGVSSPVIADEGTVYIGSNDAIAAVEPKSAA
jgi:outer membrane protein assembly factor BamB